MNRSNGEEEASASPISGARMDRVIKPRRGLLRTLAVSTVLALLVIAAARVAWPLDGPVAKRSGLRIEAVRYGAFAEQVVVRAAAEPEDAVVIDAMEGGRVETIEVSAGQSVRRGQTLLQLSNAQRQQEVLARESDVAQQLSNLETLRVGQEVSRADYDKRLIELEYQIGQTEKQLAREQELISKGFIAPARAEETTDLLEQKRRQLAQLNSAKGSELRTRHEALSRMEASLSTMQEGLKILREGVLALQIRSPIDGKLGDFKLRVGESVKAGDRIGIVDSAGPPKLVATVDEFYLPRLAIGVPGVAAASDGKPYRVSVTVVNPQVTDGRFKIELKFEGDPPSAHRGQGFEVKLQMDQPENKLILGEGPFLHDTGGRYVFVVGSDGKQASKRQIKLGRRAANEVEVEGGLNEGERVILSSYAAFGDANTLTLED